MAWLRDKTSVLSRLLYGIENRISNFRDVLARLLDGIENRISNFRRGPVARLSHMLETVDPVMIRREKELEDKMQEKEENRKTCAATKCSCNLQFEPPGPPGRWHIRVGAPEARS